MVQDNLLVVMGVVLLMDNNNHNNNNQVVMVDNQDLDNNLHHHNHHHSSIRHGTRSIIARLISNTLVHYMRGLLPLTRTEVVRCVIISSLLILIVVCCSLGKISAVELATMSFPGNPAPNNPVAGKPIGVEVAAKVIALFDSAGKQEVDVFEYCAFFQFCTALQQAFQAQNSPALNAVQTKTALGQSGFEVSQGAVDAFWRTRVKPPAVKWKIQVVWLFERCAHIVLLCSLVWMFLPFSILQSISQPFVNILHVAMWIVMANSSMSTKSLCVFTFSHVRNNYFNLQLG
jgi:hypothetical protein